MKKQILCLLIGVLTLTGGFFASCHHSGTQQVGALVFDSLTLNRTRHLFGDTAMPACNLVMNLAFVEGASEPMLVDSLNQYFTALCLGPAYAGMAPQQAIERYAAKYVEDYCRDLEPTYRQESAEHDDEQAAWYSYYKNLESQVQYYEKNLLVYRYRYEEYTGGAHGIYMTSFLNLNLDTLMPIRLDDLFVADYREALTDLLWNQLMADHQVATREELEDLGYTSTGDLVPTENFYLSREGITFYYNVYEIAPYVMGPVEIHLPWEMVQHLRASENSEL